MSLNKSATRRLSLLAGSSLVAAGLTAATFTGAALMPTSAYAYDECTAVAPTLSDGVNGESDPTLNGGAADTFSCTVATYATGITYNASGNLTVATTRSISVTANGVNLTATGPDSVTWTSAPNGLSGGAATNGPILDVKTDSGAINISVTTTAGANQAGITHGIRAISGNAATSIPGGNITITQTSGINNNVVGGIAAIEAVTHGGNISIASLGSTRQGYERGLLARTSGTGAVILNLGSTTANATAGLFAIDVTAGTGGINITTSGEVNGGAGAAVRGVTTGSAVFNHTGASLVGALDFSGVAGTATIDINPSGNGWRASGATIFTGGNDDVTLRGNSGALADAGSIAFGAGADLLTLRSGFTAGSATIDFGAGADSFVIAGAGTLTANGTALSFGTGADTLELAGRLNINGATVTFGDDDDTLNLSGPLSTSDDAVLDFGAGEDVFNISSNLTVSSVAISGLEVLNNSGVIYMGGGGNGTTNLAPGDILALPGVAFSGSGASRIVLDVSFAAGGQTDCSTGEAADCLDFTGGTTDGSTLLTVRDAGGSSTAGSSSRTTIVLGATEAGNFTLDANSDGYVLTDQGPALRKRLFDYYLLFDPDEGAYVLAAAPHIEAFQVATFSATAQDIWRTTTGSWFDRQADLRSTPGGIEPSRGLWARGGVGVADRDVDIPLDLLGVPFSNDVSYSQRTSHAVVGADLLGAATQNSAWVIGASAGFVRSDTEYETGSVEVIYSGFTGGLYASFLAGPVFVDATVNANVVDVNTELPTLGFDNYVKLSQTITSVGVQAQAGWRLETGEGLFVEPLVSVAYVETQLDDIEVPGDAGALGFEEGAKSLRAGAGLRVGLDSELMGQPASFSLTGRYWNEMEGENRTTLAGNAPTLLVDDFGGSFSEFVASVNLFSGDGGVSGFVNLGGKLAEDYQSIDTAIGVRVRW